MYVILKKVLLRYVASNGNKDPFNILLIGLTRMELKRNEYRFMAGNSKERHHFEERGVGCRVILKLIFKINGLVARAVY